MAIVAKRFWKTAHVVQTPDGFSVYLDKHQLKTPLKTAVIVPTKGFAEKVAGEWRAVDGKIKKHLMPFNRIAEAALDAAETEYSEIVGNLAGYGETDLLCYRADAPVELIARQAKHWDPLLTWAARDLAAPLRVTHGIIAVEQDRLSIQKLRSCIEQFDLFQLTAFYDLVKLSGSLIIGLAVARHHIDAKTGWRLSRLDDDWQIEQWGVDEDAQILAQSKQSDFENADIALSLFTNQSNS